jgi:hypothetical protein
MAYDEDGAVSVSFLGIFGASRRWMGDCFEDWRLPTPSAAPAVISAHFILRSDLHVPGSSDLVVAVCSS